MNGTKCCFGRVCAIAAVCAVGVTILVPLHSRAQAEDKLPTIPFVKSLAELRTLEPLTTIDDWQMRVALADGGEAACWRLIYAHATYVGTNATPGRVPRPKTILGSADLLGPLSYRARDARVQSQDTVVLVHRQEMAELVYVGQYGRAGEYVEVLFAAAFPVSDKDDLRVEVFGHDYGPVAQTTLPKGAMPPRWWFRCLAPVDRSVENKDKEQSYRMALALSAALPYFDGDSRIWIAMQGDQEKRLPPAGSLPGLVPPKAGYEPRYLLPWRDRVKPGDPALRPPTGLGQMEYPLVLSLEQKRFSLRWRAGWTLHRADWCLMCRWWVNDKPVEAPVLEKLPPADNEAIEKLVETLRQTAEITLHATLPSGLNARAGDKVRLQVLYCPAGMVVGIDEFGRQKRCHLIDGGWPDFGPMLSNVLEFEVTKEMIAQ